jgi:phage-related protein
MASPAAVLSILVTAQTSEAATKLRGMQTQLQATGSHMKVVEGNAGKMNRSLGESDRVARRASVGFGSLAKGILAAGGAFAAYEAAKSAVKDTMELTAATVRLSAATGMDAKTASSWIEVMKVRGVQSNAVAMGFITLERNMRNATDGSKASALAFKQLGIPMADIKKQNLQQTILEVADAFQKTKSPVERAAIAQQLFGRNAKVLMPVLAQGKKGIEDLLGAAQRYGAYIGNDQIKTFRKAHEAQLQMNLALDGLKIAFTRNVLPVLVTVVTHFMTFVGQMQAGKGAGGQFAAAISSAFNVVKGIVTTVVGVFGGLKNTIIAIGIAFAAVKIAGFVQDLALIAASPATLVLIAIAAAAALIIKNWSTVGPFLKNLWATIKADAQQVVQWLTNAWGNTSRAVTTAWKTAAPILTGIWNVIKGVAQTVFPIIRAIAITAFDAIKVAVILLKGAFQVTWDVISGIVRAQVTIIKFVIDNILIPAFNFVKGVIRNVLIPAFNAIKGPVQTVGNIISSVFGTIRRIVGAVINFILGLIEAFLKGLGAIVSAASSIPLIGDAFDGAAKGIQHAADTVQSLRDQLSGVPHNTSANVNVNVDFISNVAGAIQSMAQSVGSAFGVSTPGSGIGHHFSGGVVNTPGYFAGEEAPAHPEVIIASNPRYRQRNLGLWAQAGSMLGVPGFATGGIVGNPGAVAGDIVPWTEQHASAYITPIARAWGVSHSTAGKMIAAANSIVGLPYIWGGGHGSFNAPGYDCSGAVSFVLHAGGFLSSPMTTDGLKSWGLAGPGNQITVGVRGTTGANAHTMMEMFGKFFESGGGGPFGGGGVHWDPGWDGTFPILRHPPGFAQGGIYNATGDPGELPPSVLLARSPWLAKVPRFQKYMKQFKRFATGGIFRGAVSTFGPPGEAAGTTAYGGTDDAPGIAINPGPGTGDWNSALAISLAKKWFDVSIGSHKARLQVIDKGPSAVAQSGPYAGHVRTIDVTGRGAQAMGYSVGAGGIGFPTDSPGVAIMVGTNSPSTRRAASHSRAVQKHITRHFPSGPVWGPVWRMPAGRTFGGGFPFGLGGQQWANTTGGKAWANTWQHLVLHMPAPPTITGPIPQTRAGAAGIARKIIGGRNLIGSLDHQATIMSDFWGYSSPVSIDGLSDADKKKLLAQNKVLYKLREQIFKQWQLVVARTQRLIESYKLIVKRLREGLASISTKGLKGDRLTAAQSQQRNTHSLITQFMGKISSARGDLQTAGDSRDQSWLDLIALKGDYRVLTGKTPPGTTTGPPVTGGGGVSQQQVDLLSQLLLQAQQRTAVSESALRTFRMSGDLVPFAGSFASGGMWGLVGEQGPELAKLPVGTRIYNANQTTQMREAAAPVVTINVAPGMEWLKQFISVEVDGKLRGETRLPARNGGRGMPGRGGGRLT